MGQGLSNEHYNTYGFYNKRHNIQSKPLGYEGFRDNSQPLIIDGIKVKSRAEAMAEVKREANSRFEAERRLENAKNNDNLQKQIEAEQASIMNASNIVLANLAEKNAAEESRLQAKLAEQKRLAAEKAEKLAKATKKRQDEIKAAKLKGMAIAAANAEQSARERLEEERKARMNVRDKNRLDDWDRKHNRSYFVLAPEFNKDDLKGGVNKDQNRIWSLESDIFNKDTNLGECPDGWTMTIDDGFRYTCSPEQSGNKSIICEGDKEFTRGMSDFEKREWAKSCRVNWLNRVRIMKGGKAPTNYNMRLDQLKMYSKLKRLITLRNTMLHNVAKSYDTGTTKINENHQHIKKASRMINNQNGEINNNSEKIRRLDNDILTLSRKLQFNETKFRNRSYGVLFLKYLLIMLLLISLLVLLVKNANLSYLNGIMLGTILVCLTIILMLYELWKNRDNQSSIFDNGDFK